jgi:hypothetical protein
VGRNRGRSLEEGSPWRSLLAREAGWCMATGEAEAAVRGVDVVP